MKILPKKTLERISWLQVYLDDLTRVVNILNSNCKSVTVSGYGYEIEEPASIEEYRELSDDQFDSLKIEGFSPSVIVKTYFEEDAGGVEISIEEDDAISLGLLAKVISSFEARQRKMVAKYHKYGIGFFLFIAYMVVMPDLLDSTFLKPYIVYLMLLMALIHYLLGGLLRIKEYIIFEKKQSNKNYGFFYRKKDELVLLFFAATIGAVFGAVATLIVNAL